MKQYEPCIQNNNNNNNNNKWIKRKKNKRKKGRGGRGWGGESVRERIYYYFSFFSSLLDLWKSDRRFLSGLKAKLIHTARAMRGHQNLGVSSNSMRYGIFLLVLLLA